MAITTERIDPVVVDGDITALMEEHLLIQFDSEVDEINDAYKYYLKEFHYYPRRRSYEIVIEIQEIKKSTNVNVNGPNRTSYKKSNSDGYTEVTYIDGVEDSRVIVEPISSFSNVKSLILQSLPAIVDDLIILNNEGRLYRP